MKNIRVRSDWLRVALLLSEISRYRLVRRGMQDKQSHTASRMFIHDPHPNPNPQVINSNPSQSSLMQLNRIDLQMLKYFFSSLNICLAEICHKKSMSKQERES